MTWQAGEQADGQSAFQFLIGKIMTVAMRFKLMALEKFQFLIGKIMTPGPLKKIPNYYLVSIPHR